MKIVWTDTATEQLLSIREYIARTSEKYADRVVSRIIYRSEQIGMFPMLGRIVPELGVEQIREVIEGAYRIVYLITPDRIDIIAVIHGAQQFFLN